MSPASTGIVETGEVFSYSLPAELRSALRHKQKDWDEAQNTARLWAKDSSLWGSSNESRPFSGTALGWLDVVDRQLRDVSRFKALSAEVKEDGFTHLVVLGSSETGLAPGVFRQIFDMQNGSPELLVLLTSDPAEIRDIRTRIDPRRTLFIVSSKSGRTLEAGLCAEYFLDETKKAVGERAGDHFAAITDSDSTIEGLGKQLGVRHVFPGEPDSGGGASAFSDFALIPHAAAGYYTERLLTRAKRVVEASKNNNARDNAAVTLGLILGTAAVSFRRDKVTMICSRSISALGSWMGQSIAELGLIPVDGEPLAEAVNYHSDRIFVYVKYAHDHDKDVEKQVADLEYSGQPVIRLVLDDLNNIGQTMFQWQVAAAVAGVAMGVNPFVVRESGQPASQDEELRPTTAETPISSQDGIELFADAANAAAIVRKGESTGGVIRCHLDRLNAGDYFSLLAYVPKFPEHEEVLSSIRKEIVESKQAATTLSFGDRSMYSTGHRAGPTYRQGANAGVFVQITYDDTQDVKASEWSYRFSALQAARARDEFQFLANQGRRILRVHLRPDLDKGLNQLRDLICAAVAH